MSPNSSAPSRAPSAPPAWLAAVAALAAVAGVLLGQWQLDRAAASTALRERFAAAASLPPVTGTPPAGLDAELRYRTLALEGSYFAARQFLLDNRVKNGVPGYEVLTPFRPSGAGPWVLVNRGWLPANPDRRVLPEVGVDGDPRQVAGALDRLPRPGLALGGAVPPAAWPDEQVTVVSYPTAAELAVVLGHAVADYQLLLEAAAPDGYLRTREVPGLPPERHLAYAGQWLLLAALSAGGALWVLVRAWRARAR